jgi:hypothetical protein
MSSISGVVHPMKARQEIAATDRRSNASADVGDAAEGAAPPVNAKLKNGQRCYIFTR